MKMLVCLPNGSLIDKTRQLAAQTQKQHQHIPTIEQVSKLHSSAVGYTKSENQAVIT